MDPAAAKAATARCLARAQRAEIVRAALVGRLQQAPGMLLYRSAVLGLLVAVLWMLVAIARRPAPRPEAPTVVDVSRSAMRFAGVELAALVGARHGERVVAASGALVPGAYVDVELDGAVGRRRVLVLVHP
jgi:hypothetical protein